MSIVGCQHLQSYKKTSKNKNTFKWIHAVFVVNSTSKSLKTKLCNSRCRVCKKRGPFLHACLECVFFGCHKHIREHAKSQKHSMSMDLTYGQMHCNQCHDYIYDSEIDAIANDNKMKSKTCKKRLFEIDTWNPTSDERDYLRSKTKKICITPDSTIGLRGLLNLGQTCFMNCIVQALMHTPLLRDYFLTEEHNCKGMSGRCLVCEVSKLFQEFYNGTRVPLALHELLHLIWTHARHLAGYEQQDAHEFFIATLDVLHQHCLETMPDLKPVNVGKNSRCPCIIDQIFTGGLQSDVVCQKCNGVSTTIDPISDFSLDLGPVTVGGRPPTSLVDCLERFTRAEHLGENSKIMCSNCQSKQESTKQLTMNTLPIVISFHLKRFQHMNEVKTHTKSKQKSLISSQMEKKISTTISFPEMLDMTPFMSRSKTDSPFPSDNRYSLFAVINHIGNSINVGHYTAYVRQLQDYWYKCDDHVITRATLKEVLDSEGYLLFYHKHVLDYD
ncbi:Ubiquitin carboxyl-terminal hydrolase nonstop-like Protein [Tribolium castaneum]|uniref:Ubiquitin carboxyl-terminal hydrolase n=2 Tax=Tribolium castaneum TaxID=7070 RepID=D6WYJ1_TRICA|nr:Ubiquitin carboxyl-terminal hydrolase nonstop-like Protein [Tribolium castaneum]